MRGWLKGLPRIFERQIMLKKDFDLVQNDDYAAADSRALVFTGAGQNWPDLTAATFALYARTSGETDTLFSTTGTRSIVSGVQSISVPLTAAQTAKLPAGANAAQYDLVAVLSTRRITLAQGFFSVSKVSAS